MYQKIALIITYQLFNEMFLFLAAALCNVGSQKLLQIL